MQDSGIGILHFLLERIVFIIIFCEIGSLLSGGDTFAWIVLKFPAGTIWRNNTTAHAKYLFVIQLCSVTTVVAGALYFFSKQHAAHPFAIFSYYTTFSFGMLLLFFLEFMIEKHRTKIRSMNNIGKDFWWLLGKIIISNGIAIVNEIMDCMNLPLR